MKHPGPSAEKTTAFLPVRRTHAERLFFFEKTTSRRAVRSPVRNAAFFREYTPEYGGKSRRAGRSVGGPRFIWQGCLSHIMRSMRKASGSIRHCTGPCFAPSVGNTPSAERYFLHTMQVRQGYHTAY